MLLMLLFASLSWGAVDEAEVKRVDPVEQAETCAVPTANSVAAMNHETRIDGKLYPAGTEIYFDEDGQAFTFTQDRDETPIELKVSLTAFSCKDVTIIPQNPITGELEDYNIPIDKMVSGPGGKKKRHNLLLQSCKSVCAKAYRPDWFSGLHGCSTTPRCWLQKI